MSSSHLLIGTNVTYAGLTLRGFHSTSPFFSLALLSMVRSTTFHSFKTSYFSRAFLRSQLSSPVQFYRDSFSFYLGNVISVTGRILTQRYNNGVFTSHEIAAPDLGYTYIKMLLCTFTNVLHDTQLGAFYLQNLDGFIYSSNWTLCTSAGSNGGGVAASACGIMERLRVRLPSSGFTDRLMYR